MKNMVGAEAVVLVIFIISFILILSEKLHRTIAAWAGCVVLLVLGKATGVFDLGVGVTLEEEMLHWVNFEVIGLLLLILANIPMRLLRRRNAR